MKKMKRAYVGNIPFATTTDQIREWFAPLSIDDVQIIITHGKPRGFAFVEFATADDFDRALWKDGQELGGRRIVVNDAADKRRSVR
jgi:RNA recognition motif-containing protein